VTRSYPTSRRAVLGIAAVRVGVAAFVVGLLVQGYLARIAVGDGNPFDYFGFFTNQTNMLMGLLLVATGALMLLDRPMPHWWATARGVMTACLLVVAVVYNGLIPGTGTASAWVSAVLHILFPLFVLLDWLLVGDRPPLRWSRLWIVLPYPIVWLAVVLVRGVTDGWVPYGFLLPERGVVSLLGYCAALLVTFVVAGAAVWAGSRARGVLLPRDATTSA